MTVVLSICAVFLTITLMVISYELFFLLRAKTKQITYTTEKQADFDKLVELDNKSVLEDLY